MYKLSWMLSSEALTYSSVVIVEWQSPHMRTGISNPIGGKVDCSLEHLPHTARPHLRQWCWGGREGKEEGGKGRRRKEGGKGWRRKGMRGKDEGGREKTRRFKVIARWIGCTLTCIIKAVNIVCYR